MRKIQRECYYWTPKYQNPVDNGYYYLGIQKLKSQMVGKLETGAVEQLNTGPV